MLLAYTVLPFSINNNNMILFHLFNFLQNIKETLCKTTQGTRGMPIRVFHVFPSAPSMDAHYDSIVDEPQVCYSKTPL
jgi:hypothetical protein